MGKKKAAASTPAVAALNSAGISHTTHPYEHDPRSDLGYGLEAAQAIGVPPEQVFKTLMVSVDGTLTVAIIPVNCTLDLKAVAHTVHGKKATMAPVDAAQRATGYVVGGISPLGQKTQHTTLLDTSALNHDTVYVSGGRRGFDVGLRPQDLMAVTHAVTAPIALRTEHG